jgi:hypothetical protein
LNKGAKLPDGHHVIRHVPSKKLIKDDNDIAIGFFPEAFAPRPADQNSLSVNWLEYFEGKHAKNLSQSIQLLRQTRDIGKNSKCAFGVGNVAHIKQISQDNGSLVRIVFDGHKINPAHSLIRDLAPEDATLLEVLSTEVFELVLNSDI